MNNSKDSSLTLLKVIGCLIFDLGAILAYYNLLGLFVFVFPIKSILILSTLIIGLIILNISIIIPNLVFDKIGIPYSAAIVTIATLYFLVANISSILLVSISAVGYISWELIVFAIFVVIVSSVAAFSKRSVIDRDMFEKEQVEKSFILLQLQEIEAMLLEREGQSKNSQSIKLFKILKERIQASTPFGRITGNVLVSQAEDKIKNNITSLKLCLESNVSDKSLDEVDTLIEDTRKLVINREKLNIR
ncbi:hypothetical protein [Clostridium manihotivorum]|uniref:Uncharacterized protein n=1 Tax=Clostridium manihotivorum TaxID=2320868 RepID=A0A410DQM6_9CLOT|nr:hypothetical protein [Clostridium manihotivorum]QAA31352.1 hypothetical protein C1I91_06680 [Clostridium manihotivorum]